MGKYTHLMGKLAPFQQEPEFQEKVNAAKSSYIALSSSELARQFGIERSSKKSFESAISEINVNLEALSQMLVDNLEASGLSKIQLETGETCYLSSEPFSSIEDREKLIKWFTSHKMKSALTIAWQTLNSLNKERLIDGKPALPGSRVFLKSAARLRNGSSGGEQ